MSTQMNAQSSPNCTLSLSFNSDRRLGTFFRCDGDHEMYIAGDDDRVNDKEKVIDMSQVDVSRIGIAFRDRAFIAAIREGVKPNGNIVQVLPSDKILHHSEGQLEQIA